MQWENVHTTRLCPKLQLGSTTHLLKSPQEQMCQWEIGSSCCHLLSALAQQICTYESPNVSPQIKLICAGKLIRVFVIAVESPF